MPVTHDALQRLVDQRQQAIAEGRGILAAARAAGKKPDDEQKANVKAAHARAEEFKELIDIELEQRKLDDEAESAEAASREELRSAATAEAEKRAAAKADGKVKPDEAVPGGYEGETRVADPEGEVAEQRSEETFRRYLEEGLADMSIAERRTIPAVDAYDRYLRGGLPAVPRAQHKFLQRTKVEHEERSMLAGDQQSIGFLVPKDAMLPMRLATKQFDAFEGTRAQMIRTSHGRPIPIPVSDDTGNEGTYKGEAADAGTGTDVKVEGAELNAYTESSGVLKVSVELLADAEFDVDALLRRFFAERLARRYNRAKTTDNQASRPQGIVTAVGVGHTTAAGQVDSIKREDFIRLKHSVEPSYRIRGVGEFMLADDLVLAAKLIDDGVSRPLWQAGMSAAAPDTIDGSPYVINYHMAVLAASAIVGVFGDLSWYYQREISNMIVLRLVERYAEELVVGFIAYTRNDGRYVDPGNAPIKSLAMVAA